MLKNTFCHVPGIGIRTEEQLWKAGLRSWEQGMALWTPKSPLTQGRWKMLRHRLEQSQERLEADDAAFFAASLPAEQHWRLFPDFRHSLAYLDIETTGMGTPDDIITAIALYDGKSAFSYVHGDNLPQFNEDIQKYKIIVTYNGKCFDVPFIRNTLGIPMDFVHIDLRYVLKGLGYRGGLKGCEKQLGIDRGALDGVDGFFAVLLWQEYQRTGNRKALETLLAYNVEDVVNLEKLMVAAYNLKIRSTPFDPDLRLSEPTSPCIPFHADPRTIRNIKQRLHDPAIV